MKKLSKHTNALIKELEASIKKDIGTYILFEIKIKFQRITPRQIAIKNYITEVKKLCIEGTKYTLSDINGHRRLGELNKRRQIAVVIIHKIIKTNIVYLCKEFDGRHHKFLYNSLEQVKNQKISPEYKKLYNTLYSKALKLKEIYI